MTHHLSISLSSFLAINIQGIGHYRHGLSYKKWVTQPASYMKRLGIKPYGHCSSSTWTIATNFVGTVDRQREQYLQQQCAVLSLRTTNNYNGRQANDDNNTIFLLSFLFTLFLIGQHLTRASVPNRHSWQPPSSKQASRQGDRLSKHYQQERKASTKLNGIAKPKKKR